MIIHINETSVSIVGFENREKEKIQITAILMFMINIILILSIIRT